jgi:leucyl aminopeptidase
MTIPLLHFIHQWSDLQNEQWDSILMLATKFADQDIPVDLKSPIEKAKKLDASFDQGAISIIACEGVASGRLIYQNIGDLGHDYDDVRLFSESAFALVERAIKAGVARPCLVVVGVPQQSKYAKALECAILGALEALWSPLEAREINRHYSFQAFGVYTPHLDESARKKLGHWVSSVEAGRFIARDVAGTEPERMSPIETAKLCEKIFKNSAVKVEIIEDETMLRRDFPLMSAVARASFVVPRHHPRVIKLIYEGSGEIHRSLLFAGKGVVYDTGGADLKTDGHMAGMSRDKGGAAAVIGFFVALQHLKPKGLKAVALLGMVRNSIGPDSFVTDEIIESHAGIRVRIGNTDAEGRLVLSDLLSHLRELALSQKNPHLFSIATLTGHAGRAVGQYSLALDNGPAFEANFSTELVKTADLWGDCFEFSRLRREDFAFIAPKTSADDLLSCNSAPSSATPRGHQFPMAVMIRASGLEPHHAQSEKPIAYTHIDIGGSGVKGGDWQNGRPTAAPVLALCAHFFGPQN